MMTPEMVVAAVYEACRWSQGWNEMFTCKPAGGRGRIRYSLGTLAYGSCAFRETRDAGGISRKWHNCVRTVKGTL